MVIFIWRSRMDRVSSHTDGTRSLHSIQSLIDISNEKCFLLAADQRIFFDVDWQISIDQMDLLTKMLKTKFIFIIFGRLSIFFYFSTMSFIVLRLLFSFEIRKF